ncbi:MAG TPA: hypothetical protein VIZ65_00350 [Cellvibrionaceae bacterium]
MSKREKPYGSVIFFVIAAWIFICMAESKPAPQIKQQLPIKIKTTKPSPQYFV